MDGSTRRGSPDHGAARFGRAGIARVRAPGGRATEPVPFAFAAGARGGGPAPGYLSNVAPPARARAPLRTVCARTAVGLLLVAGLVAAVALGTPALSAPGSDPDARPAPARGHR